MFPILSNIAQQKFTIEQVNYTAKPIFRIIKVKIKIMVSINELFLPEFLKNLL